MSLTDVTPEQIESITNRRSFLVGAGLFGLGAATSAMVMGCDSNYAAPVKAAATADTAAQILTAALIAESLAITAYYTALTSSGVITDSNLAGAGGSALNVTTGSQINVAYLQGALLEEVAHAQLLRSLLGLPTSGSGDAAAGIPQTFYFPTGTFTSLSGFVPVLVALETAFIGAYMTAVEEFASMAAGYNGFSQTQVNPASTSSANLPQSSLILYGKVAAAILGVEAEHRALVRGIPNVTIASPNYGGLNLIPANNVNYESDANLTGLIVGTNGAPTAAQALTPFIASGTSGYTVSVPSVATMASFSSVVQASVAANVTGTIPAAE